MEFADAGYAAHHLPLRDRIDGVDVINALDPLPIALMHGVDPQVARPIARIGPPPLADTDRHRPGGVELGALAPVLAAAAEVVQVRHRDLRQTLVLGLAKLLPGALEQAPRGRSAQTLM